MFQKRSPRTTPDIDNIMMLHAYIASWKSQDPYCQSGAAICNSDRLLGAASSQLVSDSYSTKLHWDEPDVYDYVLPAELAVLSGLQISGMHDIAIYVTTVPHPQTIKILVGYKVRKVMYGPQKQYNLPKNYKKEFEKFKDISFNFKLIPYTSKFHWVKDKIDLLTRECPELFS